MKENSKGFWEFLGICLSPLQKPEPFLENAAENNPKHVSALEFVELVVVEQPQGQGLRSVERVVGEDFPEHRRRSLFRFFLALF